MLQNAPNGECIAPTSATSPTRTRSTIVNPAVLQRLGRAAVRLAVRRVGAAGDRAADVARSRLGAPAMFSNFFVYDNINLAAERLRAGHVHGAEERQAARRRRLPGDVLHAQSRAPTRPSRTSYTFASDYGDWTNHWNGVDITVNSRLRQGLTLQIGSSTGRAIVDNCGVAAKVPELLNPALTNPSPFTANTYQLADSCRKEESWQTQVRGFATYIAAEGRRAHQRHLPLPAELDVRRRRDAGRQQHGPLGELRRRRRDSTVNLSAARGGLRRPHQPDRHAVREDRQLRQQAGELRCRRPEPVQREHGHGVPAELRGRLAAI